MIREGGPSYYLGGGYRHVDVYARGAEAVDRPFKNFYEESSQAGTPGNGGKW